MEDFNEEKIEWEQEAKSVIQDVGFALKSISLASIPQSSSKIYLNVKTREGQELCVELSANGFRVVCDCFDQIKEDFVDQTYYETPYSLFDKYSPEFRQCFGAELIRKLNELPQML